MIAAEPARTSAMGRHGYENCSHPGALGYLPDPTSRRRRRISKISVYMARGNETEWRGNKRILPASHASAGTHRLSPPDSKEMHVAFCDDVISADSFSRRSRVRLFLRRGIRHRIFCITTSLRQFTCGT